MKGIGPREPVEIRARQSPRSRDSSAQVMTSFSGTRPTCSHGKFSDSNENDWDSQDRQSLRASRQGRMPAWDPLAESIAFPQSGIASPSSNEG